MTSLFNSLWNYRPKNVDRIVIFQHTVSITVLAIIALISYLTFYAPILHSDDWSLILGRWYSGNLKWFDLAAQRPLQKARLVVLYSIFGLNVHAFYAVLWTLNVLNAVQLYFLLLRFIPKNKPIAFSIAAIVLVYPADLTHMWLTMVNIRTVVFLTLLYAHLLLIYADKGYRTALWGALLSLGISFGMYEGQLGITMAWCMLVILMKKPKTWKRWLALSLPLAVGVGFVLWRLLAFTILEIGNTHGYFDRFDPTPVVIITRLLSGYRLMIWSWMEPLNRTFGLNGPLSMVIILSGITILGYIAYVIGRIFHRFRGQYLTEEEHLDQIRRFLLMVIIGPIFIAAGYVPVIAFFEPSTFFQTASRINLFASLGAAVTIAGLLTLVVLLLKIKWTQRQVNWVALSALTPFIILGVMVQIQVQYDDRAAWMEQKQIWHQLFELAPDLKDKTSVYFLLSEREDQDSLQTRKRLPLAGSWEIETALNMLYGKRDLSGDVFVRELLHMAGGLLLKEVLLNEGVKNRFTGKITPYDNALFVTYDRNLGQLTIIEDLSAEDLVDFPVPTYRPYERIIETPTRHVELRWLVGATTNPP